MDAIDHAKKGDFEFFKEAPLELLLNARDSDGNTVLAIAVDGNHVDCCEVICKRFPSLLCSQHYQGGYTPLHAAAYSGYLDILKILISTCDKAGLENQHDIEDQRGDIANRPKTLTLKTTSDGYNAMHKAVDGHQLESIKLLLQADPNKDLLRAVDHKYNTPLHLAVGVKSDPEIARWLIKADPDFPYRANSVRKTPLLIAIHKAESRNDKEMLKLILELQPTQSMVRVNEDGWTALHYCVSKRYLYAIGCIIRSYPESSKVPDNEGQNFFHLAVKLEKNEEMVKEILGKKEITSTVLNSPDKLGRTPWDVAVVSRNENIILCLRKDTKVIKAIGNSSCTGGTMIDQRYVDVCDSITSSLSKLASDKTQRYSRAQLEEFTKDFSRYLGSGGFGNVYKGQFPDGVFIAVKVLKKSEFNEKVMEEQFVAEVETMSKAYHRNLIKLYGYCYEPDTKYKALVYDYMEKSFDKILSDNELDWAKLHNIAIGIAQGISYLHESCFPEIIHQDIKPANVLLDANLSPKVIDFGLAKVNTGESQFEQSKIKGSRGYMAPEVNQHQKVKLSNKLDVYSFGMILFDILGCKRNYVDNGWFPGQVWEMYKADQLEKFILDCGIKEEDKKNAKTLATIALLCVQHNPRIRPKMSNVVKMLEGEIIQLETPVLPFSCDYVTESCSTSDTRDEEGEETNWWSHCTEDDSNRGGDKAFGSPATEFSNQGFLTMACTRAVFSLTV